MFAALQTPEFLRLYSFFEEPMVERHVKGTNPCRTFIDLILGVLWQQDDGLYAEWEWFDQQYSGDTHRGQIGNRKVSNWQALSRNITKLVWATKIPSTFVLCPVTINDINITQNIVYPKMLSALISPKMFALKYSSK